MHKLSLMLQHIFRVMSTISRNTVGFQCFQLAVSGGKLHAVE